MSSEAYQGRSAGGCGQQTVLKSPAPGVVAGWPAAVAGPPAASAIFNLWDAGTTSRRHAE
jgi:hypothetical protein